MKSFLTRLLRFISGILITFTVVFAFTFCIGWKLLESQNILLFEIYISVLLGIVLFAVEEVVRVLEKRISNLEKQVADLQAEDTKNGNKKE